MLRHLIVLFACCSIGAIQAQFEPIRKNTLFFEAGGNGLFYSLNHDRIVSAGFNGRLCGRWGLMYLPGLQNPTRHMVGVPLEMTYCKGRETHFFEVGLGVTGIYDTYVIEGYHRPWREAAIMAVARVGYRHQKREGGLFYRFGLTPMHGFLVPLGIGAAPPHEQFTIPMVALAVGYTLKGGGQAQ